MALTNELFMEDLMGRLQVMLITMLGMPATLRIPICSRRMIISFRSWLQGVRFFFALIALALVTTNVAPGVATPSTVVATVQLVAPTGFGASPTVW